MFFVSWGSKRKSAYVGEAGQRHCSYCEKDSIFSRMVEYTVRHVYWIFRWVSDRDVYLVCGNCHATHYADEGNYDSVETTKAIPAWDRRGWMAGVGGVGALIATTSLAVAADSAADKTYVAAPQVGDVYQTDMARIVAKPEAPQMFTTMRVVKVGVRDVEVEVAKRFYENDRGVTRDLSSGAARQADYYAADHLVIPKTALQKMYDENVVQDVDR